VCLERLLQWERCHLCPCSIFVGLTDFAQTRLFFQSCVSATKLPNENYPSLVDMDGETDGEMDAKSAHCLPASTSVTPEEGGPMDWEEAIIYY